MEGQAHATVPSAACWDRWVRAHAGACLTGQASLGRKAPSPCLAPREVWGWAQGPSRSAGHHRERGDLSAEEQLNLPQAPRSPTLQRIVLGRSVGAGLGSETPASLGLPST